MKLTLIDYLSTKGYSLTLLEPGVYCGLPDASGKTYDDFIYDSASDKWQWKSRSKSGIGLVDYLKKIVGASEEELDKYIHEIETVTEGKTVPSEVISHEKKRILSPAEEKEEDFFTLPPKAGSFHAVDKYYMNTLSISPNIIKWLEEQGLLYESNEQYQMKDRRIYYHNAIFVCIDCDCVAQGAIRQYLRPDKHGTLQVNRVSKSDPHTGFSRITPESQGLLVFENIPEMLSYFTLQEMIGRSFMNQPFLCLDETEWGDKTLPKPLVTALKQNPMIRAVFFAVGKDLKEKADKLASNLAEKKRTTGVILSKGNSFSEDLLKKSTPTLSLESYVKQFRNMEEKK